MTTTTLVRARSARAVLHALVLYMVTELVPLMSAVLAPALTGSRLPSLVAVPVAAAGGAILVRLPLAGSDRSAARGVFALTFILVTLTALFQHAS